MQVVGEDAVKRLCIFVDGRQRLSLYRWPRRCCTGHVGTPSRRYNIQWAHATVEGRREATVCEVDGLGAPVGLTPENLRLEGLLRGDIMGLIAVGEVYQWQKCSNRAGCRSRRAVRSFFVVHSP